MGRGLWRLERCPGGARSGPRGRSTVRTGRSRWSCSSCIPLGLGGRTASMVESISLMPSTRDITGLVYRAERYFASLVGERLHEVSSWVTSVADAHTAELMGCDKQGERIVGAAAINPGVRVVDTSRRLDGRRVVLVAGALAGPIGLERATCTLRALGATEVHCAWVTGWAGVVGAADTSRSFDAERADAVGAGYRPVTQQ